MKRILFSLSVLAMAFTASSQTIVNDDFESFNLGDLDCQNCWFTYSASDDHSESDFQIVNITNGYQGIEIKGQAAEESLRDCFKNISWDTRTAGNDNLFMSFTLQTGTASASANTFELGLYDESFGTIAAFMYDAVSQELFSGVYATSGGTTSTKYYYLVDDGNGGGAALTLAENTEFTLSLYFDKSTGIVALQGVEGQTTLFTKTYLGAKVDTDPKYVDFISYAGTGNTLSTSLFIDNFIVKARPCLVYDTKDDVTFSYSESTLCNTAAAVTPTLTDASVTGTFTSTPAGLSIDASSGLVTASSSTVGTYTVQFASNVDNTCDDSTTVSLTIQDCASLPEHFTSAFSVAPNPAQNFITVTLSDNFLSNGVITLMTSEGKEVETRIVSNNKEEVFNVYNLEAGIYFVKFADKIEKVVIQ